MAVRQPRYSKEEFAQRGDLIYQTQIRPQVEADNHGKIVAIDIETGDFEVDAREIAACNKLEARHPDAQILQIKKEVVASSTTTSFLINSQKYYRVKD